jgi:hypothetical protein
MPAISVKAARVARMSHWSRECAAAGDIRGRVPHVATGARVCAPRLLMRATRVACRDDPQRERTATT